MARQPRNEAELARMNPDDAGLVNRYGLSRKASTLIQVTRFLMTNFDNKKHIFDSVKESLQRLQVDYIDVLQCDIFTHYA